MYNCPVCQRGFAKLGSFQHHRALCELLAQGRREKQEDGDREEDQLPSRLVLWQAMQVLLHKYEALESEFRDCRAWIKKQKKKLNIVEWLNEHHKPPIDYTQWLHDIQIGQTELQWIFQHNFVPGMFYILQHNLPLEKERDFPIRAFNQKKHVLFVFENNAWRMLDYGATKKLVDSLNKKLWIQFNIWGDAHPHIKENTGSNEWDLNVQKINGGKESYDVAIRKISKKLYEYLKFNLKSRTHYEFVA